MAQVERESAARSSRHWMLATWLVLGLAVLTKGLAALLITGAVLSIYVLWHRDWTALRTLRPVAGGALFLAVTAPWFIAVARANPDFLQFFFVREHIERYLTDVEQRMEPWWYFAAVLVAGALPWLPQMLSALFRGWRTSTPHGHFDPQRLLWIWCVFVLVFFSLSSSKLAPYILPMFPPLALLTAAREAHRNARTLLCSAAILLLFAIALLAGSLAPTLLSKDPAVVQIATGLRPIVMLFVAVALATAAGVWRAVQLQRFDDAVLGLAVASFLGLAMLIGTVGHEPLRSGQPLAAQIPAELAAHAPLFSVRTYDQTIPFYLQRTMFLVDTRGELEYGLQHAPGAAFDMPRFEATWVQLPQGVAIMSHDTYAELCDRGLPMRLLGEDKRRVAVSRQ
jgi:4-amino-4-deoxy-L-arabinose transferase-like glycosyltransferase